MKNYFLLPAFLILIAFQIASAQTPQWHYLGDTVIEQTWATGALTCLNGSSPIVAYTVLGGSDFVWRVKRFDGSSWAAVDTNGLGSESFQVLGITKAEVLQIAYYNSERKRFGIKRLLGTSWVAISESPEISNYPYLASYFFDDEKLYIAFAHQTAANSKKLRVWKFEAGNWTVLGQTDISLGNAYPILKVDNGIPWVAYEDWGLNRACVVKKFDGNTWQTIGNQVYDGDPHGEMDFAVSNGVPFIAHADSSTQSQTSVLKFNGTDWVNIGPPAVTAPTNYVKLAIDDNNQQPYLLFEDHDPSFWGLSALRFDGADWGYVGKKGFIPNYWNLEFVIKDGVPHVGYEFSAFGGGASVQVYSPLSTAKEPVAATEMAIRIQPNPIRNGILQLQVSNAPGGDLLCQIVDQTGRLLKEMALRGHSGKTEHQISLGNLPMGTYTLLLLASDGKLVRASKQFTVTH